MNFASVLALIFIALKLTHSIAWSWVWVLSPLWIGFVIWSAVVVLSAVVLEAHR